MVGQPLGIATDAGATRRLTVYVAVHCVGCPAALRLVEEVRAARPLWKVDVVDTDVTETPPWVIATPMYAWGRRVLFWGNPSEAEMLAALDRLEQP